MAPPLPFLPPEWHGKPIVAVIACWSGALGKGKKMLAPLKEWGRVAGAFVERMPYPAINTLFDAILPAGLQHYWKGSFVRDIPEAAIEAHLKHSAEVPCMKSGTHFFPLDGACHRVPADGTAFAYRDAAFANIIAGTWKDRADNERNIAWVRRYYEALRPFSEEGGYVNFLAEIEDPGPLRRGAAATGGTRQGLGPAPLRPTDPPLLRSGTKRIIRPIESRRRDLFRRDPRTFQDDAHLVVVKAVRQSIQSEPAKDAISRGLSRQRPQGRFRPSDWRDGTSLSAAARLASG